MKSYAHYFGKSNGGGGDEDDDDLQEKLARRNESVFQPWELQLPQNSREFEVRY